MNTETRDAIAEFSATAEGWTKIDRAMELAELVLEAKPTCICEIGVFSGSSLIPQALALRELGHGVIYGIDPWRTEYAVEGEEGENKDWWAKVDLEKMQRLAVEAIWRYHLDEYAVLIRAASQHCHELFREIDILSIDGSHSEVAAQRDVNIYLPKVRQAGYVWMDDVNWTDASGHRTTETAVSIIEQQCELVRDGGKYRLYIKKNEP